MPLRKRIVDEKGRSIFRSGDVLHVIRLGNTSNKKIMANSKEKMVQTYHFSRDQFNEAIGEETSLKRFFEDYSQANCMDCPLRKYGNCYTHKFTQARGFLSMLRSIAKEFSSFDLIPELNDEMRRDVIEASRDRFVRFGTYGEPSLLPFDLIELMVNASKSHTGYTHQWRREDMKELSRFFMASANNSAETLNAVRMGWRVFETVKNTSDASGSINCPASKESGFKSSCDKCGLCSGTEGKGKVSIHIIEH